jgi:large subunit ribosomal protein L21
MYAIFETGGKQYKVAAGDVVRVEKLPEAEEGKKVSFDKILVVSDGKETHVGTPYLDAATMDATVTAVGKGDKVIVFKFKAKKGYRRKQGHRQPFTEIEIESVSLGGRTVFKNEKPEPEEKPESAKKAEEGEPVKSADAEDEASAVDAGDADKTEATPAEPEKDEDAPESENDDTAAEKEETAELEDKDIAPEKEETAEPVEEEDSEAEQSGESDADSTDEPEAEEEEAAAAVSPKMTKADIMAKLDELGASYSKRAKKDELLAILAEVEK